MNKYYYYADIAQKDYKGLLTDARSGINMTKNEFNILDHIVTEYVKQGQPIYHIIQSNDISISERQLFYMLFNTKYNLYD